MNHHLPAASELKSFFQVLWLAFLSRGVKRPTDQECRLIEKRMKTRSDA